MSGVPRVVFVWWFRNRRLGSSTLDPWVPWHLGPRRNSGGPIHLYNKYVFIRMLRLRLERREYMKIFLRVSSGMPCERVEIFFITKNNLVGVVCWWTYMSQVRFNPETIRRMVVWMAYNTKSSSRT